MLTERETQIVQLAANGMSAKEIARELDISYRTVQSHVHVAKTKLDCKNSSELTYKALKSGVIMSLLLSMTTLEYQVITDSSDYYGDLNRRTQRSKTRQRRDLDVI